MKNPVRLRTCSWWAPCAAGLLASLCRAASLAAEPSLDDLQRRLDDAKRQTSKQTPAAPKRVATDRIATLVVRSDSACTVFADGKPLADLQAEEIRTFNLPAGDAIIECRSSAEPQIKQAKVYKLEAGTKVVVQLELQSQVDAARHKRTEAGSTRTDEKRALPAASTRLASTPLASTPLASTPLATNRATTASMPSSGSLITLPASRPQTPLAADRQPDAAAWERARAALAELGPNDSMATALRVLLNATDAADLANIARVEAYMSRLPWHSAFAFGVRDGMLRYNWQNAWRSQAWAIDAVMSACQPRAARCTVVLTDGKFDPAAFRTLSRELGARPQSVVRAEVLASFRESIR